MISLYDELSGKIDRNASRPSRDGARRDLGLLLFAEREAIDELWKAAARVEGLLDGGEPPGPEAAAELRGALERLRPLFGERGPPD